jgi:hypothetical protein
VGFLKKIAEKAAKSEGHARLAAERGLSYETIGSLPEATPLLRAAEVKSFSSVMQGRLGDSIQGYAAIMTHDAPEDYVGDNDIDTTFDQVVLGGAVDAADFIPTLVVSSRSGWEPLPRERLREISTESSEVSKRYRIWIGPETSESNVRQLLSPVMVDWLANIDVQGFAFELDKGWFCAFSKPSVYIPIVSPGKPEELAWLMDTADELVKRILAEVAEE